MSTELTAYEPRTLRQKQLRELSSRGDDGCIEWPYARCRGYGWLNWSGKRNGPAHRLAYLFAHGYVGDLDIMHLCNNKACVNLRQLKAATTAENLQAAFDDGLREGYKGQSHPRAKLSDSDVLELRSSAEPAKSAALRLGVRPALIYKIRNYDLWRHLP